MRGCDFPAAARASMLALAFGTLSAPGTAPASTKHHAPSPPASSSFAYSTTGTVASQANPSTVSGPAVLQFQGVGNGTYAPGSGQPIDLGQFVVAPTPTPLAAPTIYSGTPFEVRVRAPGSDKTSSVPLLDKVFPKLGHSLHLKTVTLGSLLIDGHLNGTVAATGQSGVTATIDSVKLGGVQAHTQDHITRYAFPIRFSQLKLPPSWTMATLAPNPTLPGRPLPAQSFASPAAAAVQPPPAAETIAAPVDVDPIQPVATPEPSTLATFAVALAGLAAARHRRRPR